MVEVFPSSAVVTGVVLAGGRGRRMNGLDKGLMQLEKQPLVAWALAALEPQVARVLINANRHLIEYAAFGVPVVADVVPDFAGPLAGMSSGLAAARTAWVVTVPCDAPLVPPDLVARLARAVVTRSATVAAVTVGERRQPLHALMPVRLAVDLNAFLSGGGRRVLEWMARLDVAWVDFGDQPEAFVNLNSPEAVRELEMVLSARRLADFNL